MAKRTGKVAFAVSGGTGDKYIFSLQQVAAFYKGSQLLFSKIYDTNDAGTVHSGKGKSIFVMDAEGHIYASKTQKIGEFHHSSFLAGEPVSGAGEITIHDGIVTKISNGSGHYKPTQEINSQVLRELNTQGVKTQNITITGF